MNRKVVDERDERINGQVSFFWLMLTQIALVGLIAYKRYFQGLPAEAYSELSFIAFLSMGGFWAIRLYLSGVLPVISFKKMLIIYIALVAVIFIPTYFIHGWPPKERWFEVLFPFIGVAVALGFYSLAAFFGKRRIERMIGR